MLLSKYFDAKREIAIPIHIIEVVNLFDALILCARYIFLFLHSTPLSFHLLNWVYVLHLLQK